MRQTFSTLKIQWILLGMVIFESSLSTTPIRTNCSNQITSVDLVEPPMKRLWQQLQQQTDFR